MKDKKLIVITGPTASGKSALAVTLARKLETEIISADSRQIYKGIPIVTAVPTEEERKEVEHHLLEILPLDGYYSASKFQEDARSIMTDVWKDRDTVVVCGGSMMYIDALVNGIDDLPTVPPELREHLMKEWTNNGNDWLLGRLKELNNCYYNKIDHRNLKRVFHAVEISITAGKPYSALLTGLKNREDAPYRIYKICLNGDRSLLFDKINARVLKMQERGLEDEARRVYHLRHLNSLNTVGLKEMFAYFEGKLTKEEAIARIQKNTRVYAKKQLTWHKRDNKIIYLDFNDPEEKNITKILREISAPPI